MITSDLDRALAVFLAERTHLLSIARRIVGNAASCEDVVQEVWVRWQRTNRAEIENPAGFLATAARRVAINLVRSARYRHETPTDTSQQEVVDRADEPPKLVERADGVEQALGVMLARLTPAERAVYLLRRGFDYEYDEIARMLHTSAPNTRQIARRAQQHLVTGRRRDVAVGSHRQLVQTFRRAADTGDLLELEQLLT